MDYEDPGWLPSLRYAIPFVSPFLMHSPRFRDRTNPLVSMRGIILSHVVSLFALLIPLLFVAGGLERHRSAAFALLIIGDAALAAAGVSQVRRRPFDTRSETDLAAQYRGLLFIGIGLVESIALVGFVGVFVTGHLWTYLLGMALSLAGFAAIAPTRRDIERRQARLDEAGTALSLGRALTEPASGGGGASGVS